MSARVAVYELRVTVTVPIDDDVAEDRMVSLPIRREIEKTVIAALRRLEWPSDVECMGVNVEEE